MMMSSAQRETGGPDTDACEWTRGYAAFEGPAATAAALPPYTQAYVHNVNTFKRVPLFEVTQITNGPLYLYYDGFQLYATTTYHHDQSFHPYVLRANGGREPWTTTRKLLLSTAPREKGTPVFDGDVVVVPTVAGGTTTYTIAHTAAASSSMDIPGHADVDALRHQALQGAWSAADTSLAACVHRCEAAPDAKMPPSTDVRLPMETTRCIVRNCATLPFRRSAGTSGTSKTDRS